MCTKIGLKQYEVARGVKFDEESFRERFSDLVYSVYEQDVITLAREIEKGGRSNYGGVYFSNRFRVNSRIFLDGLGFLGPAVANEAVYEVSVDIFESKKRNPLSPSRRIAHFRKGLSAKRGEIYFADFKTPVNINPGVWYDIQFCLEGPDTARLEKTYREVSVSTSIGTLQFDFLEGSKQMPKLKFRVA